MRRAGLGALALAVVLAGAGWVLTGARPLPDDRFAGLTGDVDKGRRIFVAAGCASCHAAPGAETADPPVLAGGRRFPSPFGTFVAPNISTDAQAGIGAWTQTQFANAVLRGVSPEGAHYFPAFPYTAYSRMTDEDLGHLWAYVRTLPADATPSAPHEVGFPFNIRRGVGLWKRLYMPDGWQIETQDPVIRRGRYLVEALAHCAECHTPRTLLGGLDRDRWMAGAPDPSGKGTVPALTPSALQWSEADIAYYLETGFTPDFDSAGGHMAAVVANFARLPAEDRAAVAAYVAALPDPPDGQ